MGKGLHWIVLINVCRIIVPISTEAHFVLGFSALFPHVPKPCKINETTGNSHHDSVIALKWNSRGRWSVVCSSPLCLLGTGPSFPSPLCLALFFIRLLLGRKLSLVLLILLQHKTGGVFSTGETLCHLAALHPLSLRVLFIARPGGIVSGCSLNIYSGCINFTGKDFISSPMCQDIKTGRNFLTMG